MTTTYYPQLLESRILNDSRVDQSGGADGDVTDWTKTDQIILATQIGYNGKDTAASAYKLQYRNETDSPGGAFGDVGSSGEVAYAASSGSLSDGTALTSGNARCTDQSGSMTWQNGLENVNDNTLPDAGTFDLGDDYYSEFQWALDLSGADDSDQYTFQLYNTTEGAGYECGAQITIAAAGPEITDADDEDFINGEQAVTITGTNFGASQGSGKVELGDSATYGSANLQTQSVESWGDTSIDITIVLGSLTAGTLWLYVTDDGQTVSNAYQVTVANSFNDLRQDIIDGLDSAQSETYGWNNEVRDKIPVTDVVRTSDTVCTITLSAESGYDITLQETITVTVPASVLVTSGSPLTGSPTFTVDPVTGVGIPVVMSDYRRRKL